MKKTILPFLLFGLLFLTGCATYHISTQSLVEQMANSGTEKKTSEDLAGSFQFSPRLSVVIFYEGTVKGNTLTKITCLDNKGKEATLDVDNRTSIRITKTDSSRVTFYFNTLLVHDSIISGSKTHFFEWQIHPVLLKDISKIEIQKD
jgi:hypothetical protein